MNQAKESRNLTNFYYFVFSIYSHTILSIAYLQQKARLNIQESFPVYFPKQEPFGPYSYLP